MQVNKKSLSTSITYLVIGLVFTITLVYSLFILLYSWLVEDNIFNRLVAKEAAYIEQTYVETGEISKPRSSFMRLSLDWQDIPPEIIRAYAVKPSRVEYTLDNGSTAHIQVLILGDQEYVLIADIDDYEVSKDYLPQVLKWLVFSALFCSLLVSFIAYVIAQKLTKPIQVLARKVEGLNGNEMPKGFANEYPDNEVKLLANAIEQSFSKLQLALDREVNFTRDVSHEIRTPISVLKNVLDSNRSERNFSELEIAQLSQSCFELETTTNTLLALAREESSHLERLNMTEMIEDTLLQHFALNHTDKGKALSIETQLADEVCLEANRNLVQIILNNIIANIVQYAAKGEVQITLTNKRVSFSNETTDEVPEAPEKLGNKSENSSGIGQGLNLIERICQSNNWRICTTFNKPIFTLTITFN